MAQPAAVKIANPGPLGLMGFGVTTFVLSVANSNLYSDKGATAAAALPLALAFGGGAQLLAGMWEFRTGNTFGATAFTSYGAFWIATYFLLTGTFAKDGGTYGVPTFFLGWTIFTLVMTIASYRVNGATASLFTLLFVTFALLTLHFYTSGDTTFGNIAGYVGIVTALNAFYNAAAGVLKDLAGKDVLPVFPFPSKA